MPETSPGTPKKGRKSQNGQSLNYVQVLEKSQTSWREISRIAKKFWVPGSHILAHTLALKNGQMLDDFGAPHFQEASKMVKYAQVLYIIYTIRIQYPFCLIRPFFYC
jgi:hypothetical protein